MNSGVIGLAAMIRSLASAALLSSLVSLPLLFGPTERRLKVSGSAQKHHHEWGDYLTITNVVVLLAIFAWVLLKDCSRILTNWPSGH